MNIKTHCTKIREYHNALFSAALLCAIIIFAGEEVALSKINGWWGDELNALWVTDPSQDFVGAFWNHIMKDPTPPLYYSALYWFRNLLNLPFGKEWPEVVALNIILIILASVTVIIASRRSGLTGLAFAGVSAFLISGPILAYAQEGRAYTMAMSLVFVATWFTALAIEDSRRIHWLCFIILGFLAALTHLYAALMCGGLAAGLMVLVIFGKRRELLLSSLALGISASVPYIIWFLNSPGPSTFKHQSWIKFTFAAVLKALSQVKQCECGSYIALFFLTASLLIALANRHTRPITIVFFTATFLFFSLPVLVSFKVPVITGRYWLIGGPSLVVITIFLARAGLVEGINNQKCIKPLIMGLGSLVFLISSTITAFPAAYARIEAKPLWKGIEIVRPLVGNCPAFSIHVWKRYAEEHAQLVPPSAAKLFIDASVSSTPWISIAESHCPVIGWVEDAQEVMQKNPTDEALLQLLKINARPEEVEIYRHRSGYVVIRRKS